MDDKELNLRLGRQLRKYRKKELLTIGEVAGKIGMNDKHLGRIERGEKYTSFTTVYRLMEVLKIPSKFIDDIKNDYI